MRTTKLLSLLILASLSLGLLSACAPAFSSPQAVESYEEGFGGGVSPGAPAADMAFPESEAFYDTRSNTVVDGVGSSAADRIVIKNASISIAVSDPAATLQAIMGMAEEMGGFVVSSNLYQITLSNGAETPQADVTVRVPAARLNEALAQIKTGSNQVLSENVSGEDVTQTYTDLQSRLRNLEFAEEQMREILDQAVRTEDVLNVFNQLTSIREQIEIIKGQIQYYEQSAAFSAISVGIRADAAVQPLTVGGWQPQGVARDAVQSLINALQGIADAAIWLTLFVLPVLLVILLLLFIPLYILVRLVNWLRKRNRKPTAPPAAPAAG